MPNTIEVPTNKNEKVRRTEKRKLNACPPLPRRMPGQYSTMYVNGRPRGNAPRGISTIGNADGGPRQRDGAAYVDEYRELAWLVVLPTTSSAQGALA